MIPYPRALLLDHSDNYGILKTETVFGFQSENSDDFLNVGYNLSNTNPLQWVLTPVKVEKRGFDDLNTNNLASTILMETKSSKSLKNKRKRTGKGKKCVVKFSDKNKLMRRRRRKNRSKMSKMVMPLLLGLMTAKSILIPVALKSLAFISAKGFLMGFFSTILASILSLKGMFDNSHRNQDRKDEKTQVEVIQVPNPTKEEHYYDDDAFYTSRREDLGNLVPLSETIS